MKKIVKQIISIALVFLFVFGALGFVNPSALAASPEVQCSGTGTINANRVNIRTEQNTKGKALSKADKGDTFSILGFAIPKGYSYGFFKVAQDNEQGFAYIAGDYLNAAFDAPLSGTVTKKGYAYTGKSTSRKYRTGVIAVSDLLPLYAREGKWWKSELDGKTVWIQTANVQNVSAPTVPIAQGVVLTPSTTASTYGSVKVTVSGAEGAAFVGWRTSYAGAVYKNKTGFTDITSVKQFTASRNGLYAVCVLDAQGRYSFQTIQISNIQYTPPVPTYAITMTNDGFGTASTSAASAIAGTQVTITATPNANYGFYLWDVVSGGVTLSSTTDNPATFTMPASAVELKATFVDISTVTTYNAIGTGTQIDPWRIYNDAQLASLATVVNAGNDMSGQYFKLMNDVSLSVYTNWTAIGNETNSFKGNFDGNSKVITGLAIAPASVGGTTDLYYGLFGCLDGGSIANISVSGTFTIGQFELGQKHVGGVIGYLKSGSVSNIAATVSITTTTGGALSVTDNVYVGGAIGKSDVTLSASVFNVTPTILFGIDGVGNGYVGHNVGWCVNWNTTQSANSPYGVNDASITITKKGGLAVLYVNGNWVTTWP